MRRPRRTAPLLTRQVSLAAIAHTTRSRRLFKRGSVLNAGLLSQHLESQHRLKRNPKDRTTTAVERHWDQVCCSIADNACRLRLLVMSCCSDTDPPLGENHPRRARRVEDRRVILASGTC